MVIGIPVVNDPQRIDVSQKQAVAASSNVPDGNLPTDLSQRTFNFPEVGQSAAGVYLGSSMLGHFLTKIQDAGKTAKAGCTIAITNSMGQTALTNPAVLLTKGTTKDPPSLRNQTKSRR